ncbi:MAG: hypothetical protein K0Q47_53 [Sedimentibacter sp.]|jgi:hypothetical protein|nr:hypothetical protein [Sedimentibacter sp.]
MYDHYEINVSLHGRHFFATASRSITDTAKLTDVLSVFDIAFPKESGYEVSIHKIETRGIPVNIENLRKVKGE